MTGWDTRNKVLLIEDNPGDARLVEIYLQEAGFSDHTLIHCSSLAEGMAVLKKETGLAAVLLDLSLPDSHGFPTLEKLIHAHPTANVIVLTGQADREMGVRAVKAGAQEFLVKGAFDPDLLGRSLRFSIERSAVLTKLEETQRLARIGSWEYHQNEGILVGSDEFFKIMESPAVSSAIPVEDLCRDRPELCFLSEIHEEACREGTVSRDIPFRSPSDKQKYLFLQCHAEKTSKGYLVSGIVQDITERKLTDDQLVRSQDRYLEIFTQSRDAIYIARFSGEMIECNQAAEQLFRKGREELMALPDIHELFYPPERRNEFLLKIKFQQSVRDFEIELQPDEGASRLCLVTANYQESEGFEGYNAIVRDITSRKQTDELIKARDLARQSAELKEQFMASISHEMRTPMNAILGMSNLLAQTRLSADQQHLVDSIRQSSEILLGIVNDILEVATIQNGNLHFTNEPFDLFEIMHNMINVMQYKAREKDLFVELELEPRLPRHLMGDKLRLNQILFNLVGNAIKFTDEGKVGVRVEKLNDFEGGVHLRFCVSDTGIGIPEEQLDRIFESFNRVRQKDRLYEGTGLGLSISKSLVEQQGGKIRVTSEEGKGSVFTFDLIFELSDEPEIAEKAEVPVSDPDRVFRLLLVEDHKINQLVARKTLEKHYQNIRLSVAENGRDAIRMLEEADFDIILMDVQMPVMDGYEATRVIREELVAPKCDVPVLAMTAHAHLAREEKYLEYGMNDFVLKPFQPEQLFLKIDRYLKKD